MAQNGYNKKKRKQGPGESPTSDPTQDHILKNRRLVVGHRGLHRSLPVSAKQGRRHQHLELHALVDLPAGRGVCVPNEADEVVGQLPGAVGVLRDEGFAGFPGGFEPGVGAVVPLFKVPSWFRGC